MSQKQAFIYAALIVLAGLQALFVAGYVNHEHTIYFWDHAMYFNMARQFHVIFEQSLFAGWAVFKNALAGDYNLLYALPSLISFGLFGPVRLVFILTNFFIFFLAYEIAFAFFLRRAFGLTKELAFIISLITASLSPPVWLPLLEGYPDIGAAACIVFAAALVLEQPKPPRLALNGLKLGLILGLAVLLRRHFVYAALALLATVALCTIWEIGRQVKDRRKKLGYTAIYFVATGIGFAGLLALIAPAFLQNALTVNYGELYRSYQRPAAVFLRFVGGGFGIGLLLVATSGLFLGAHVKNSNRKPTALVGIYAFLWLVIWCFGPDQMGHHYILQALPLFVMTGLAGWFVFLAARQRPEKYIAGGFLLACLCANSAWALWFSPVGVWPNDNGRPGLVSAARPPVVRTDYDEWLRLADYLRRTTKPTDRIMMVGSSFVFNQDLLHSIYTDILQAPEMATRFPKAPEIDHEEPAPLNVFAAADVYLVPEPAQFHLDPAGQRVITAAAQQFPPPPARTVLFHADDARFHLADGVTVKVWRRHSWPADKLHETLEDIRRAAPQDVNFAQDWATTALPLWTQIHTDKNNYTAVVALFDPEHRELGLFFDYPLAAGAYRLAFSMASDCAEQNFHFDVLASGANIEMTKSLEVIPSSGDVNRLFSLPAGPAGKYFLEIDFSTVSTAFCRIELRNLRIESAP